MSLYNSNNLLQKAVYDVAFYGEDIVVPLVSDTLNLSAFTWSSLDALTQSKNCGNSTSRFHTHSNILSSARFWL